MNLCGVIFLHGYILDGQAERVELYRAVLPPGENISTFVTPTHVEYYVLAED